MANFLLSIWVIGFLFLAALLFTGISNKIKNYEKRTQDAVGTQDNNFRIRSVNMDDPKERSFDLASLGRCENCGFSADLHVGDKPCLAAIRTVLNKGIKE